MRELNQLLQVTGQAISEHETMLIELEQFGFDLKQNEINLESIKKKLELFEEVRIFFQELAEIARVEVASDLEHVVTLCLQAVFGEDFSFEIEIDTSRNNTVIEFYVIDNSGPEPVRRPPEASMGGGTVDTCAIGLRFGLLQILDPKPVGPIILDEPAKMVSEGIVEGIASLLKELTTIFKKQTILVTHHKTVEDVIENPIHFEKVNGYTRLD